MLAIGMLLAGVLVRALGLLKGLSMGDLMSWAIGTTPAAARFSWHLQPPPPETRPPLEVLQGSSEALRRLQAGQLSAVAARLRLLNRMDHTLASTEHQGRALMR